MSLPERIKHWFISINETEMTLRDAKARMDEIALEQEDIPWIIKMVENPKWDIPGFDIFSGATDLNTHDYIHLLLGRGVMPKDEAFVLGFTMGSTNRVGEIEERLYTFFAKYLYPKVYRFKSDEIRVYKDAVRLGYISRCTPLDKINYEQYLDLTLEEARKAIGIESSLLKAYYEIEKSTYPKSIDSQRLI